MRESTTDEDLLLSLLERSREPWLRRDIGAIIDEAIGAGFGYRTRAPRLPYSEQPGGRERLTAWYDSLDYIRLTPGDTAVLVDGDVAVVHGFFTEDFQHKGGEPQSVTVRFSNTAVKRDGHWVFVWAHRDATPFDDAGRYAPRADP